MYIILLDTIQFFTCYDVRNIGILVIFEIIILIKFINIKKTYFIYPTNEFRPSCVVLIHFKIMFDNSKLSQI